MELKKPRVSLVLPSLNIFVVVVVVIIIIIIIIVIIPSNTSW